MVSAARCGVRRQVPARLPCLPALTVACRPLPTLLQAFVLYLKAKLVQSKLCKAAGVMLAPCDDRRVRTHLLEVL